MAQIRNKQALPVAGDRDRIEQRFSLGIHPLLGKVHLGCRVEIGLAQHNVGRLSVGGGDGVPDQHAVILRVGDEELAVLQPHTLRTAEGLVVRHQFLLRSKVVLANNDIGGLATGSGQRAPNQNAVVVCIGHDEHASVRMNPVGGAHVRGRRRRVNRLIHRRLLKVLLPQHHIGFPNADRAAAGRRSDFIREPAHVRQHIVEDHDAAIVRLLTHAAGIGNKKRVVHHR